MRRVIAGMAAAFSLLLLTGWRYRGRHMLGLSVATGSASGLMVGAISMGGPPIFLYLMAGPGGAGGRIHLRGGRSIDPQSVPNPVVPGQV